MKMLTRRLGIDIGSSKIRVFVKGKGILVEQPSCVAFDKDTGEIISIGEKALDIYGRENEVTEVIHPIQGMSIKNYTYAHALIDSSIRSAIGDFSLIKPDIIFPTHPGSNSVQVHAFEECLLNSGIRSVYLEQLPLLAARGAQIPFYSGYGQVIADIGKETLNVAVISAGGIVDSQTTRIGGLDIDEAIISLLKEEYEVLIGYRTAEYIKKTVGSAIPVRKEKHLDVEGLSCDNNLPRKVTVSTNDIARVVHPVLQQFEDAIKRVINTIPPQMTSDIIDYGVVLSGGTANFNFLARYLSAHLGIHVHVAQNPDRCVINGIGTLFHGVDIHKKESLAKR